MKALFIAANSLTQLAEVSASKTRLPEASLEFERRHHSTYPPHLHSAYALNHLHPPHADHPLSKSDLRHSTFPHHETNTPMSSGGIGASLLGRAGGCPAPPRPSPPQLDPAQPLKRIQDSVVRKSGSSVGSGMVIPRVIPTNVSDRFTRDYTARVSQLNHPHSQQLDYKMPMSNYASLSSSQQAGLHSMKEARYCPISDENLRRNRPPASMRRKAAYRPPQPLLHRLKRRSEELRDEEKWRCPYKCGKYYRKTSTRSIQKHLVTCDLKLQTGSLPRSNSQCHDANRPTKRARHVAPISTEDDCNNYLPLAPTSCNITRDTTIENAREARFRGLEVKIPSPNRLRSARNAALMSSGRSPESDVSRLSLSSTSTITENDSNLQPPPRPPCMSYSSPANPNPTQYTIRSVHEPPKLQRYSGNALIRPADASSSTWREATKRALHRSLFSASCPKVAKVIARNQAMLGRGSSGRHRRGGENKTTFQGFSSIPFKANNPTLLPRFKSI
ncbi:hypothetical protein AAMO2058_000332100 [Amorphochlora amoebiformis]